MLRSYLIGDNDLSCALSGALDGNTSFLNTADSRLAALKALAKADSPTAQPYVEDDGQGGYPPAESQSRTYSSGGPAVVRPTAPQPTHRPQSEKPGMGQPERRPDSQFF